MNNVNLDFISNYLFDPNGRNGLIHAGTGRSVGPDFKSKLMEVYKQEGLSHHDKRLHDTPVNERNIEIIHVLPALAKDREFFDKLNRHAENFCRNILSNIADSKEIQVALEEPEKLDAHDVLEALKAIKAGKQNSKVIHSKESLRSLEGVGNFLESILEKYENDDLITDNEKKIFRFLLVSMLKIDPNTDDSNMAHIIGVLTRYFHPDKSRKDSDLYSYILNKGFHLAKVVGNGIRQELYDDPLLLSIANLKKLRYTGEFGAEDKIIKEMLALKASGLKDKYKEKLLRLIIKFNESDLLEIMINRLGINNLKINNEIPLIYVIQNGCNELVIKKLIENGDVNALGLEGKTPLQIAIDCYKNWKDKNPLEFDNPFEEIIQWILDYHKLCVDAKDSKGLTALCHIALWPKLTLSTIQLMNKLITQGANIDQPIENGVTVRSFLQQRLKKKYFSDIETLADNPEDIRIDLLSLIQSIGSLSKHHSNWGSGLEKLIEKMQALKASDLKGNDKEKLLMSIIQADQSKLLDIMIYRLGIDNLKVNNETPLIYAIHNGGEYVIKKLIKKEDVNALGLEGKTPLQIAICSYKKWKKEYPRTRNPYEMTIRRLLDCHKLCVDAKDSNRGFTALCHIAMQLDFDSTSLQFINQLINLGANIDHPFVPGLTVRGFLKKRLSEEQFSDIEMLADNLEGIRTGVESHGDEIDRYLPDAVSATDNVSAIDAVPTNSRTTMESSNSPLTNT
ncbi:ankyrin repeat domain-containing protein [Salinisphaera sp. G21_0]|uniref:ankyrin repeat domain-containing protein n=1 Tax=Salinisphaera sp. G21_0 TaxID=2821094 RepID=UPI001ADBE1A9|nr:ankyrin repeat domain-containing protein [Salinisphaera sp. G21_0]MBO9481099.1 hypothetical protein [Salinisphaera sp. G21_0]